MKSEIRPLKPRWSTIIGLKTPIEAGFELESGDFKALDRGLGFRQTLCPDFGLKWGFSALRSQYDLVSLLASAEITSRGTTRGQLRCLMCGPRARLVRQYHISKLLRCYVAMRSAIADHMATAVRRRSHFYQHLRTLTQLTTNSSDGSEDPSELVVVTEFALFL